MSEYLTKERELELGERIQNYLKIEDRYLKGQLNDEELKVVEQGLEAIDEMFDNYQNLVYSIANGFKTLYPSSGPIEDIIQDGMLGMMNAIRRYDPSRGNKFSTMAYMWIKQNIGRTANQTSRMVRLPENRITDYTRMLAIEEAVVQAGGTIAEARDTITKELGLSENKIREILSAATTHASLNKVVGDDTGAKEFGEFFPDDSKEGDVEDFIIREQMFSIVDEIVLDLDEEEKSILSASFSFDIKGIPPMSPSQVKKKYGLTNAGYNKGAEKAVRKIKSSLDDLGLSFEDFVEIG